jgi:hypothetical protein
LVAPAAGGVALVSVALVSVARWVVQRALA